MSLDSSLPPIPAARSSPEPQSQPPQNDNASSNPAPTPPLSRSNRPSRACTLRAAARQQQQYQQQQSQPAEKRRAVTRKEPKEEANEEPSSPQQCGSASKIVTSLVAPPPPSQLPRWTLRSMWELAAVLNFLHVFRPLLNITGEFSAEELETALITPNDTLSDIHIPLMKAIPPVTRMALTRDTWVTVLCRKLRDWWHWVAEGELPIVASHGAEIQVYKTLDPGVRVVILKALCDIRVEQEDIRNYIDNSMKHGVQLSSFRKERVGGDSQGISYWYEDDPIIGHRLYREIRKLDTKKIKGKGSQVFPNASYQWETVATNFDEFQDVAEKLFSSKNRTEASLGKKLKGDMLVEIERVHKRKEKLLKKQHRQALLLDNFLTVDGLGPGRSLRDRKPVTYTFDDYDRSINEALKVTKRKQPSPDPLQKREVAVKPEASSNGKWSATSNSYEPGAFSAPSPNPKSPDYDDDVEGDDRSEQLDRSNRRRQRPQRYSEREFVGALSDNEVDFDSDDDIVGEAIYDEEYLKKRKERKRFSSSSEGDEEYHFEEENAEEEEEEEADSVSDSENSDQSRKFKKLPGRTRRETKLRSSNALQSGLRRSKRATRNRIDYRQLELSESEAEPVKPEKSNASDRHYDYDASENGDFSMGSQDSDGNNDDDQEMEVGQAVEGYPDPATRVEKEQNQPPEKPNSPGEDEVEGVQKRRFLDLNELAPGSCFDDGPNTIMKDDTDDL